MKSDITVMFIMMSSHYKTFIEKKQSFEAWCAKQVQQGVNLAESAAYNMWAKKFEELYVKPFEEYERKFEDGERNS